MFNELVELSRHGAEDLLDPTQLIGQLRALRRKSGTLVQPIAVRMMTVPTSFWISGCELNQGCN